MFATPLPACSQLPVHITDYGCLTALGSTEETHTRLLENEIALKSVPVTGPDGGEPVPLALRQTMAMSLPPRWWPDLVSFMKPIQGDDWGSARKPILLTGSNFGIDGLYALGKTRDAAHADWATPHACAAHIQKEQNWGDNLTIMSHACVSAQLGLYQAAQLLHGDQADSVLVLSYDYVGPFVAAGFHSLKILNSGFPAPYEDKDAGAIGLGDGVAYAVLSRKGKGARIIGQLLYNEMFHFTANQPDGIGFQKVLDGLRPTLEGRNFWIKGHGTGTLDAGRLEARAVHARFPGNPLVSWKGSLGHTLGSCALVELALALKAHEQGRIPGTVGSKGPSFSPDVAIDAFPASTFDSTLLMSNAFGGAHGAMVVDYA